MPSIDIVFALLKAITWKHEEKWRKKYSKKINQTTVVVHSIDLFDGEIFVMTAFARPNLLDQRYSDIAETSAFTYDDDNLVNYADFLR
jgi:hypothetical protein